MPDVFKLSAIRAVIARVCQVAQHHETKTDGIASDDQQGRAGRLKQDDSSDSAKARANNTPRPFDRRSRLRKRVLTRVLPDCWVNRAILRADWTTPSLGRSGDGFQSQGVLRRPRLTRGVQRFFQGPRISAARGVVVFRTSSRAIQRCFRFGIRAAFGRFFVEGFHPP